MNAPASRVQELIHLTALCTLLQEALERVEGVASEEFRAALAETCTRARQELAAIRGTAA